MTASAVTTVTTTDPAGDCATRRISRTLKAKFSKGKFRAVGEKLKTKNAKQSTYSLSH
jgi:hypothetical protein